MTRITDLTRELEGYLEPAQVADVYRAYLFGAQAHEGQQRLSGEPYISHPLEVATIMAQMRMDHRSIMAAILHDVMEDTPTVKEHLVENFGAEVAELVDGVSKLTHIKFETAAEAQAANFRKMMLAMVRDIRVIMIKLADRLHNMRTLGVMRPEKRRRIARETLDIYVPIANRLGMNTLRLELEDLGFQAYYPMRSRVLKQSVVKARGYRKEIIQKIETSIMGRLTHEEIEAKVIGREKHLYSLYCKMREKRLSFSEVMDVYAFRIIVDHVDTCYRTLGVVHNLYKPVPGRFKDYIAIPKSNGYQSLHTVLFGPYGVPIEIQIRTEGMDKVAEAGIAAHWLYKSGSGDTGAQVRAQEWLRKLLEMQQSVGDSLEFLENVKIDLFPDEVYVFTPKGQILELPRGSTAVDFAYAVHTDVGNTCVAAKVDRKLIPLRTPLQNGQTVEVIATPGSHPNPVWLDFVMTGKARSNIRQALKNLKHDEAVNLGKRLLNKTLVAFSTHLDLLPEDAVARVLADLDYKSLDDLLEAIGLGRQLAFAVTRRLMSDRMATAADIEGMDTSRPLALKGTEGMVVSFAKCCRPIPGDSIIGFISVGRGIVVHTDTCKNVADFRNRPEKWIDVQWEDNVSGEYPVDIRVDAVNRRGVLATVAAAIAEFEANIENVSVEERDGVTHTMLFTITVRDRVHLARIIRRLRAVPNVVKIARTRS